MRLALAAALVLAALPQEEDATERSVSDEVVRLMQRKEPAVLCSHRPVLPLVFAALGVPDHPLDPGALFIAHHRNGHVMAYEHHAVPSD